MTRAQIEALVREWLKAALDRDEIQRTKTGFATDFARHSDMTPSEGAGRLREITGKTVMQFGVCTMLQK